MEFITTKDKDQEKGRYLVWTREVDEDTKDIHMIIEVGSGMKPLRLIVLSMISNSGFGF